MFPKLLNALLLFVLLSYFARAEEKVTPTAANVAYGNHPRQILDFYQAEGAGPRPLVFYLHGGGWMHGNKEDIGKRDIPRLLQAGISVITISYRYVSQAQEAHVSPPVRWPMDDAARALQFVRSKAKEWNLDPTRIAGAGGSAGACTVLWLALHDDRANPASEDLIARESTRLCCVALDGVQSSLDPQQMREWTPNSRYGGHAFGLENGGTAQKQEATFEEFLKRRTEFLPWIRQYSPIEYVSADDPPAFLWFKAAPALGQPQKDPTHSANFGVKLKERLNAAGVECVLYYPELENPVFDSLEAYLIARLGK